MSNGLRARTTRTARRSWTIIGILVTVAVTVVGIGVARNAKAATYLGSVASARLNSPIVDMAATPTGGGYWLVAADGGIFSFGDARYFGSTGAIHLAQPIVGMTSTPSGHGYWLVAADGGIFSFGDAHFYGSTGAVHLAQPIVGMASTPSGHGYWLVAADGGIFSFGDAKFRGSAGGIHLAQPIVGMAATHSGHGYWLVAADGGIFSFGDAHFYGSTGGIHLVQPMVGMAATVSGHGYWLVASDGGIFNFGDAHFYGSAAGTLGGEAATGIVASPRDGGYWIASEAGAVNSGSTTGMRIDPHLVSGSGEQAIATELVNRMNRERAARGLHALSTHPLLAAYATNWARHLGQTGQFVHQDLMNILRAANGTLQQAGENLFEGTGSGATDAGTAHLALMHSDEHRANLLLPEEQYVGIGVACMNGHLWVVEDFATGWGPVMTSHPTPPVDPIVASDPGGASC